MAWQGCQRLAEACLDIMDQEQHSRCCLRQHAPDCQPTMTVGMLPAVPLGFHIVCTRSGYKLTFAFATAVIYICRLHFVLTICYNLWVMWVLSRYFKDFVLVRQHYLSKGMQHGMMLCRQAGTSNTAWISCSVLSSGVPCKVVNSKCCCCWCR